jgi:hypothetical protein
VLVAIHDFWPHVKKSALFCSHVAPLIKTVSRQSINLAGKHCIDKIAVVYPTPFRAGQTEHQRRFAERFELVLDFFVGAVFNKFGELLGGDSSENHVDVFLKVGQFSGITNAMNVSPIPASG